MTLIIIFTIILAAGCSDDGKAAKKQLLDAMDKQKQITSHRYHGTLDLDLGSLAIQTENQPYTAVILNAMRQGKISWNGAQDVTERMREAELQFATTDDSMTFTVPILQQTDQLYIHVPLINADGEYFAMTAPPQVEQIGPTSLSALASFISEMDNDWFTTSHEADETSVRMTITKDNWLPFLRKVNEAMPNIVQEWQEANVITAQLAASIEEKWQTYATENATRIRLSEDQEAYIDAKIGKEGYMSSFEIRIVLEIESSGTGTFERYGIHLQHHWEQLDEPILLQELTPESTVPLEELLRFIP